jgi:F-type H+-transporting ATPase subunit gamma
MAASNMKAVKLRMRSIESTMQITRAMQLVAASKLRKAKERADATRPTFKVLHDTLVDIAVGNTDFESPYTEANANEKWLYVVIAGDRGMAGGYNANIFRKMAELTEGKKFDVLPLGKKAVEYYRHREANIVTEAFAEVANINMGDCLSIADIICDAYKKGEYGHIAVCYTGFISMLTQRPSSSALLPLSDFWKEVEQVVEAEPVRNLILYEPTSEEVFDAIVPQYLAALVYTAKNESVASELAARRTAMDAATKNAGEMLDNLSLYYNRARQASITQEITETVAGAEGT